MLNYFYSMVLVIVVFIEFNWYYIFFLVESLNELIFVNFVELILIIEVYVDGIS